MARAINRSNLLLVELDEGVLAKTSIPSENHAALRAGFAGYTSNPRWCASKFVAWRTGRAWRDALESGRLAVRPDDCMLVPSHEMTPKAAIPRPKKSSFFSHLKHHAGRMQEAAQL